MICFYYDVCVRILLLIWVQCVQIYQHSNVIYINIV